MESFSSVELGRPVFKIEEATINCYAIKCRTMKCRHTPTVPLPTANDVTLSHNTSETDNT